MRILMLGNSYIFTNDLPHMLQERTGAEVVHHTRGGARLSEQLNADTALGARTLRALTEEHWDYVVLQEMSNAPVRTPERFAQAADALCRRIHDNGAVPVFYVTWAYQKGGKQLEKSGLDYDEMYRGLQQAYRAAAQRGGALLADVGTAFYHSEDDLFRKDGSHPNEAGSRLAAAILAETILRDAK